MKNRRKIYLRKLRKRLKNSCVGKRKYFKKAEAYLVAAKMLENKKTLSKVAVYLCEHCSALHISTRITNAANQTALIERM